MPLRNLLLIAVLRAWFARPEAEEPAWYRSQGDPIVGRALRIMYQNPAHPWTVASLATEIGVSRAALARRFHDLVGEPPMKRPASSSTSQLPTTHGSGAATKTSTGCCDNTCRSGPAKQPSRKQTVTRSQNSSTHGRAKGSDTALRRNVSLRSKKRRTSNLKSAQVTRLVSTLLFTHPLD